MSSIRRVLQSVGGLIDVRDLHFYGGLALLALAGYLAFGAASSLGIIGAGLIFVAVRG